MRVALVGKGGAGKSVVAGLLARLLARAGQRVLAVDSDPLPGLAVSLGLGVVDFTIPDDAVVERAEGAAGPRFTLRPGLSAADAVDSFARAGPDGVRFLQVGKVRTSSFPLMRAQWALRQLMEKLPSEAMTVVGDLPGGTRQPFLGWAGYADTAIVVVPPTAAGVLSARRLAKLAGHDGAPRDLCAVVSQARGPEDAAEVARRTGLEVLAAVPYDDQVRAAERRGRSVLDDAPGSEAVAAVEELARRLVARHARLSLTTPAPAGAPGGGR